MTRTGRDIASPADPWPDPTPRRVGWTLLGLIVVGILIRAPHLFESLWYDEIACWRDYGNTGLRAIVTTYADPSNHVAHTALTWISVYSLANVLGDTLALRLPALLFSLLSIPAMFALARRVGGPRLGLIAAALITIAPVSVLEGVEARGYSMMICCSAAATWCMLAGLEATGRSRIIRWWASYVMIMAIGVWAHPITACLAVGHAAWLLATVPLDRVRRPRVIGGLGAVAAAGAVSLALYAPILDDFMRLRTTFTTTGGAPALFGPEGLHALWQLGGSWTIWAAAPGLVLLALGLTDERTKRHRTAVALATVGLPIMAVLVIVIGTWVYARFSLFVLPGAVLAMALGITRLMRSHDRVGIAVAGVLAIAWTLDATVRPPRQPLRDAAAFIAERDADATVLVVGLRHEVMQQYAGTRPFHHSLFHGATLERDLADTQPNWIIILYPRTVAEDRYDLLRNTGFTPTHTLPGWIDWGNGEIQIWDRKAQRHEGT